MFAKVDLVSIIVPIYNSEKYLRRCITSILNQTYTEIEIILVDDGSTDKSGRICDEFAKKDSRVRVIHKENGGVSSARNIGMDNATGKYFLFADSDDWISVNAVQRYIDAANKYGVDLVVAGGAEIGLRKFADSRHKTALVDMRDSEDAINYVITRVENVMNLYSADIIRKNNIRFSSHIKYGEDTIFSWTYLKYCNTFFVMAENTFFVDRIYLDSATYRYYENIVVWKNEVILLLRELIDFYGVDDHRAFRAVETYLTKGMEFSVLSAFAKKDENVVREKIKECLDIFDSHITYCEQYRDRNNEPKNDVIYTRDVDLIYQKYAAQLQKNNTRNLIRNVVVKLIGPFVERKYTKLVMAGKM